MHSTTHIKVKRFALYNISGRKLYNTKEAKEIYNHLKLQSDSHKKKKKPAKRWLCKLQVGRYQILQQLIYIVINQ